MQFLYLGDRDKPTSPHNFNLLCPITGLQLYENGELIPQENYTDYYIPLLLLPEADLRDALSNPQQWLRWGEERRLTFTTRGGLNNTDIATDRSLCLEHDPIETINIRPSRYGGNASLEPSPPEAKAISLAAILDSPLRFADAHQKLAVHTSLLSAENKARLLKAARVTRSKSPDPENQPAMGAINLSGCFMNILAREGYQPNYSGGDDDQVFFRYFDDPKDTAEQVKAYLETLPDHYLTYVVTRPDSPTNAPETNFHLFDLNDLERTSN